jgi:aminoglycoside phosphotransferase (APT) family kinase protein
MFDFEATSAGADWIDELAKRAWHTMQQLGTPPTVVHADWRSDNIRVSDDGTDIVAIYDWDSVRLEPEATALGQVAAMHSVDWSHRDGPYFATAIECVEFAASVESARHEPYSMSDWRVVRASIVYGWCYTARCEHAVASAGHDKPEFGMRHRLLADGAALLAQG